MISERSNGIGGVEHRMDLMYQGVATSQIPCPAGSPLPRPHGPMFGLYGKKGASSQVRCRLVIYDPRPHLIVPEDHHMNMDYSPGGLRDRRSRGLGDVARHRAHDDSGYVGSNGHGDLSATESYLSEEVIPPSVEIAPPSGEERATRLRSRVDDDVEG